MSLIRRLERLGPEDTPSAGGKAVGLARLLRKGLTVPAGLAVTTASHDLFMSSAGLAVERDELLGMFLGTADERVLREACAALASRIGATAVPLQIMEPLLAALEALAPPYAVRSSAVVEDSTKTAFAGVFLSVLNVERDAIEDALRRCWAATVSYEALTHCMQNDIDPASCRAGLVVQQMVPATCSGVVFSREPTGQLPDTALVSVVEGLGDSLMDGTVAGESVRVDRRTLEVVDGETTQLSSEALRHLVEVAIALEKDFGHPQDVEWARVGETLHFLQSRAVTTLEPAAKQPIEWTRDLSAERFPKPISPLGWSVLERSLADNVKTMAKRFGIIAKRPDDVARLIDHHVYTNKRFFEFSSIRFNPLKQVRYAGSWLWAFGGFMLGLPRALLQRRVKWLAAFKGFDAALAPHARQILSQWDQELDAVLSEIAALRAVDTKALSNEELWHHKLAIDAVIEVYMEPDFAVFVIKGAAQALLERFIRAAMPDQANEILGRLTSGVVDNITLRRNKQLEELYRRIAAHPALVTALGEARYDEFFAHMPADVRASYDHFMSENGHATANWDIMEPTWEEAPDTVLSLLRAYTRGQLVQGFDQHTEKHIRDHDEGLRMVRGALANHGGLRRAFGRLLRTLHQFMRIDEEHNFYASRFYFPLRALYLEVGRRLVERGVLDTEEDVFFLTVAQIERLLSQQDAYTLRYCVRQRRSTFARALRAAPPHDFIGERIVAPDSAEEDIEGLAVYLGVAASPGSASGRVRVVDSDSEMQAFEPGEVLVVTSPKPNWTPLYAIASAVVASTGSILSHGLISAREYNLPAVIGIPNVTRRLQTGQEVLVDGSKGLVRVEVENHDG